MKFSKMDIVFHLVDKDIMKITKNVIHVNLLAEIVKMLKLVKIVKSEKFYMKNNVIKSVQFLHT